MSVADLSILEGRSYPAGRRTVPLAGGPAPLPAQHFCLGHVTLAPHGGQVPWHNQDQEEVYMIIAGRGEMCVDNERRIVTSGQAVYIPPRAFHQITNLGGEPLQMLYCYAPAGEVAHWRQELEGTLPRAGIEAPRLPKGAQPQRTGR